MPKIRNVVHRGARAGRHGGRGTAAWYLPISATCRKMDFIGKLHH
jgi:hypothetical protein